MMSSSSGSANTWYSLHCMIYTRKGQYEEVHHNLASDVPSMISHDERVPQWLKLWSSITKLYIVSSADIFEYWNSISRFKLYFHFV